jgi:hypothetical protein
MVIPWNMPLLGRLFSTAALVSVVGGWLLVFQWGHAAAPRTAPVAAASLEAMQLLRDEHGLVVAMLKNQLAKEKNEPPGDGVVHAVAPGMAGAALRHARR